MLRQSARDNATLRNTVNIQAQLQKKQPLFEGLRRMVVQWRQVVLAFGGLFAKARLAWQSQLRHHCVRPFAPPALTFDRSLRGCRCWLCWSFGGNGDGQITDIWQIFKYPQLQKTSSSTKLSSDYPRHTRHRIYHPATNAGETNKHSPTLTAHRLMPVHSRCRVNKTQNQSCAR